MEILKLIYPYTLAIMYVLAAFAIILLFILLIRFLKAKKELNLALASIEGIQDKISTLTDTFDSLSKDIQDKNNQFKQFVKKFGLFLTAWHILFPKKHKRRH